MKFLLMRAMGLTNDGALEAGNDRCGGVGPLGCKLRREDSEGLKETPGFLALRK
jgi:hypothetical protein